MTDVLIVARTRIGGRVCIGGLTLPHKQNVRLMTAGGDYQPLTSPFQVGQIYDFSLVPLAGEPPHVENVRVKSVGAHRTVVDMAKYLRARVPVVTGGPMRLFEGKLKETSNRRPYIGRGDIPGGSVQFWEPDADLILQGTGYVYQPGAVDEARFTYAGVDPAAAVIPAGTLVRISLATWWPASDPTEMQRCYTQVSGWFG